METALSGGKNKTAIFDGPGPQKNVPVSLSGDLGECGWSGKKFRPGLREPFELLRKAHVVASGDAEAAPGKLGHIGYPAGGECRRFAIAFAAGQANVEHVNLVVTKHEPAGRIKEVGSICGAAIFKLYGKRANV